jgi:hypothetical protein
MKEGATDFLVASATSKQTLHFLSLKTGFCIFNQVDQQVIRYQSGLFHAMLISIIFYFSPENFKMG